MPDHIVGLMFNKNEADLLQFTLPAALDKVDSLFIADDGSTDNSWDIIRSYQDVAHIEYAQRCPNPKDPGQRQALLTEIRKRYKPENTWVQIIESDITIVDTDVREALKTHAIQDMCMGWHLLNGSVFAREWAAADTWPNWTQPIQNIMHRFHWLEIMLYTFRPLPDLNYQINPWRPWPVGFSKYSSEPVLRESKQKDSPILAHYGYRGPTHFYNKYKHMGNFHKRHTSWELTSPEAVARTVPFFNGIWNGDDMLEMNRSGWIEYVKREHAKWEAEQNS